MSLKERQISFKGRKKGPSLLILGCIHGNEIPGDKAIDNTIEEIKNGEISILAGTVTFLSPVNKKANDLNVRFIDEDLNRVLKKQKYPKSYEAHLANELCNIIDEHDIVLDIHSTLAPGPPSVFIDFPTIQNEMFAEALDTEYALFDWPKLYENNSYSFESYDSTRYVFENGKIGVILECGQHTDPHSIKVAKNGILRTMTHFKLIEKNLPKAKRPSRIFMHTLESKYSDDDHFTKRWGHLEFIPKGTIIAERFDGKQIVAKEDARILFPKHGAKKNQEWFYLGAER